MAEYLSDLLDRLSPQESAAHLQDMFWVDRYRAVFVGSRVELERALLDGQIDREWLIDQVAKQTVARHQRVIDSRARASLQDTALASRARNLVSKWPDEKLRGSRVVWADMVPANVAEKQVRWERLRVLSRMHGAGLTQKEIALRFGVSAPRVHQLLHKARVLSPISPVETFLSGGA